jgi:RsiW-degrading membrane proteinase PrsW (M82 family)/DNA-directed RNA polymerase subunit RPC12/RpoP
VEKHGIRCAGCDRKVVFEERYVGKRVKCPGCSEPILLTAPVKPAADVLDPFAELTEPKASLDRQQASAVSSTKPRRSSSADVPDGSPGARNPPTRKKSSASMEASIGPIAAPASVEKTKKRATPAKIDDPVHDGAEESAVDDGYCPDEPYIDEFGLAELGNSEESWAESKALPPVSKQFVKKKPRKSTTSDASPAHASGNSADSSAPSRAPKTPRPVTTFRSSEDAEKSRRYRVYVLFLLTMIPLCFSIVFQKQNSVESRVADADGGEAQPAEGDADNPIADNPEGEAGDDPAVDDGMAEVQSDDGWGDVPADGDPEFANIEDPEEIFAILPGERIPGAFLGRNSSLHWLFAGISGAGFMILFLAMFRRFGQDIGTAIFGAAFTATAGIIMLMGFQWAAFATRGFWLRGRGIVLLIFLIIKLIGFSYQCALEEGSGFVSSFMGFTLGVGICEEVCKILPVIGYLGTSKKASWQGACLVGLASGVGFGVSEGIMYSSWYYNGISTGDIYVVRFISCVALHSVWTGAGAVLLYFNQDGLHGGFNFMDIASTLGMTLGISIVLHGLYDTLLKQEMPFVALLMGVMSIAWLIYIIERQTREDGVLL